MRRPRHRKKSRANQHTNKNKKSTDPYFVYEYGVRLYTGRGAIDRVRQTGVDREELEKHAKSEQMERNGVSEEVVGIVMKTNHIEGINRETDIGCPGDG